MSNNNELKDGPWINYYFNGQLAEKGNYKDGKREGPCSSYFCVNGQLIYEGNYKDGKEEGPYSSYYYNGQLMQKGSFKEGKREGPWVSYHEDGSVNSEFTCFYKDGSMAQFDLGAI
tara:strand:+ start:519 stop:866 length:348 start_codon:yes stop_codon:yes gene_type:complete